MLHLTLVSVSLWDAFRGQKNLSGVLESMYSLPRGACFLIEMATPPKGNSLEIIQRKYIKLSYWLHSIFWNINQGYS